MTMTINTRYYKKVVSSDYINKLDKGLHCLLFCLKTCDTPLDIGNIGGDFGIIDRVTGLFRSLVLYKRLTYFLPYLTLIVWSLEWVFTRLFKKLVLCKKLYILNENRTILLKNFF